MNGEHHSEHQNLQDPAANADESLSWQQASLTTISDAEHQHALNCASTDQRAVIDQVFTHHRSHILNNTDDQLLLFVTGGAGVGKSFLIRLIKEMLIRQGWRKLLLSGQAN